MAGVNKNDWFLLPKVYSKKILSVEREEIATPKKVSKWKYLGSTKSEIIQADDIETGMLIWINCMKALEPLRIIPSKDGVPYAYQTKLGWLIVEPIQNDGHQNLVKCNRVLVKEASTSKLARDRFHIENADKDMSIENMFAQMYYQGFN